MAQYGFDDLVLKIDDANGDLTALTAYVTELSGFELEAVLEDGHTVGDSWTERVFTGLKKANDFDLKGFYDDTAAGPNALLPQVGEERSFQFTWGPGKTTDVQVLIKKWERSPKKGELTKFSASLQPSGQVQEDLA
jgi:hypothetical protein